MLAAYVHDLDPVALPIWGNLALRWYGLAYLLAFVVGLLLLRHLARRDLWVLPAEKAADFIAAAALLGVFLGGRLGYVLFYQIPREGWRSVSEDPLGVLRVWDGGMASHGGILGLFLFTWFYARRAKVSWTGLGDGLCVVAPLGILFGRLANFINGELYGRVAAGLPWAVKFPSAFNDGNAPEHLRLAEAGEAAAAVEPALAPAFESYLGQLGGPSHAASRHQFFEQLLAANRESDEVSQAIAPYLLERHPSQLYAAFLEGALLFAILWLVRVRFPRAPHGTLTGLFFALYASFRIFGERFREPDAAWMVEDLLTRGQFLSLFMYAFAAAFLVHAWRRRGQHPATT